MSLETPRLLLHPAMPSLAGALLDFYVCNCTYLRPFEPVRQKAFFTAEGQQTLLEHEMAEWVEGRAYHFYLALREDPDRIIGSAALNSVVRGGFQSCFLGYKLDEGCQGWGFMTEAVTALVQFAFETLGLHRIEANIMPRNLASLAVVRRCGFQEEGISPKYLNINGVWEDHVHMVRRNLALESE